MEKEVIEELKKAFEEIVAQPPFNGTVSHRTRPMFLAEWRRILAKKGIKGYSYVDDLLKALGKKSFFSSTNN